MAKLVRFTLLSITLVFQYYMSIVSYYIKWVTTSWTHSTISLKYIISVFMCNGSMAAILSAMVLMIIVNNLDAKLSN